MTSQTIPSPRIKKWLDDGDIGSLHNILDASLERIVSPDTLPLEPPFASRSNPRHRAAGRCGPI